MKTHPVGLQTIWQGGHILQTEYKARHKILCFKLGDVMQIEYRVMCVHGALIWKTPFTGGHVS